MQTFAEHGKGTLNWLPGGCPLSLPAGIIPWHFGVWTAVLSAMAVEPAITAPFGPWCAAQDGASHQRVYHAASRAAGAQRIERLLDLVHEGLGVQVLVGAHLQGEGRGHRADIAGAGVRVLWASESVPDKPAAGEPQRELALAHATSPTDSEDLAAVRAGAGVGDWWGRAGARAHCRRCRLLPWSCRARRLPGPWSCAPPPQS